MIRLVSLLILFSLPALAEEADPTTLTLPGAQECAVDLPLEGPSGTAWTDAERWAWDRICLGETADLRYVDGDDGLPCKPTEIEEAGDAVPATRVLRTEFVKLILTREPWVSAPVKPQVDISCARIDGRLELRSQHVRSALYIYRSDLPGGADLLGARFDRSLSFEGSVFGATLWADRLQVEGSVVLRGGAKFNEVRLFHARIGADLVAGGSEFKEVWLVGAKIDGNLMADGSEFEGFFNAGGLQVEGNVFLRDGASFLAVDLPGARIRGHLQLAGSDFAGDFDLTGATIGELVLFRPGTMEQFDAPSDDPDWGGDARLILRNAALGALQSRPQSWQRKPNDWIEAELTGLSYDHLGGFRAGAEDTLIDAGASTLIDWIEKTRPANMATRYDPGPYEQLAAVLDREGLGAKANAVRFAKFARRSAAPPDGTSWWSRNLFWPLSHWLLGYGVYPFWLLGWFAGLVALGVVVSRLTVDERLDSLNERFWYSLENALPLVELKQAHKEIQHGSTGVEFFFHAQKVLGFLFATLLVGALSLLTE